MKNNELTAVKGEMPSFDGLPQPVIEYVMGLVAENQKLKSTIAEINNELCGKGFEVSGWHLNGDLEPLDNWFTDNGWDVPETINTDAAIADIESVGAEKMFNLVEPAVRNFCNPVTTGFIIEELVSLAANLRAGRKG